MLDVDAFAAVADLNQDLLAVLVVFHDTDNGVVRSLVQEPRLAAKALVPEAAVLEPVLVLEELEPLAGELEEAAPAFFQRLALPLDSRCLIRILEHDLPRLPESETYGVFSALETVF